MANKTPSGAINHCKNTELERCRTAKRCLLFQMG